MAIVVPAMVYDQLIFDVRRCRLEEVDDQWFLMDSDALRGAEQLKRGTRVTMQKKVAEMSKHADNHDEHGRIVRAVIDKVHNVVRGTSLRKRGQ